MCLWLTLFMFLLQKKSHLLADFVGFPKFLIFMLNADIFYTNIFYTVCLKINGLVHLWPPPPSQMSQPLLLLSASTINIIHICNSSWFLCSNFCNGDTFLLLLYSVKVILTLLLQTWLFQKCMIMIIKQVYLLVGLYRSKLVVANCP